MQCKSITSITKTGPICAAPSLCLTRTHSLTGHGAHVALSLQRAHNGNLVLRLGAGEHIRAGSELVNLLLEVILVLAGRLQSLAGGSLACLDGGLVLGVELTQNLAVNSAGLV